MINSVMLQVNSFCNLSCKHCFYQSEDLDILQLDYDRAVGIINKLLKEGLTSISFTFKEPLLNFEVFRILEYCKKKKIKTNLLTNGILLEKYTQNILSTNITSLGVSLDGIDAETNDLIRGNGSYDKVIIGIKKFLNDRILLKRYIPIIIYLTINGLNKSQMSNIPYIFNDLGVDKLVINTIDTSIGAAKSNENLIKKHVNSYEIIARSYSKLKDKRLLIELATSPLEIMYYNLKYGLNLIHTIPNCGIISNTYHINAAGDFSLCFVDDIRCNKKNTYNIFSNLDDFYKMRHKFLCSYKNTKDMQIECQICQFNAYCYPCYLKEDAFIKFRLNCYKYMEEINKYLRTIYDNLENYIISAKITSYFEEQGETTKFVNLTSEGLPDITIIKNLSKRNKETIKKIFKQSTVKLDEICKEDLDFLNFLVSTNCFNLRRVKNGF